LAGGVNTSATLFHGSGVDGLLHDKTRKSGKAPIPDQVVDAVPALLAMPDRTTKAAR